MGVWVVENGVPVPVIGAGVAVRKSAVPGAGMGLFAAQSFEVGDPITVYDGLLVHKTAVKKPTNVQSAEQSHYLAVKQSDLVVQGLTCVIMGRGGGSFANHSFEPNARLDLFSNSKYGANWHVYFGDDVTASTNSSHRIVVLVAKVPIPKGEEIFIKYSRSTCERMGISAGEGESEELSARTESDDFGFLSVSEWESAAADVEK